MIFDLFIFLIISLSGHFLSEPFAIQNQFVVWNIGQGQWTTQSTLDSCLHIDSGGEFFPITKIKKLCHAKKNFIFISHWDLDHINGIEKIKRWPQVCLYNKVDKTLLSARKLKILSGLKECDSKDLLQIFKNKQSSLNSAIQLIYHPTNEPHPFYYSNSNSKKSSGKSSNELSNVYVSNQFLIPGDSTSPQEIIWSQKLDKIKIKALVLGHHGSRTSTSETLLQHLPNLQWAVASARWARYKHPHPAVVSRLQRRKIPLLLTEDWGSLHWIQ